MRIESTLDFGPVKGLRMGYAPFGNPLMSVICYQLDNILIDTGAKNVRPSLEKLVNISALDRVLLTHHHEDHAGNAAYLNTHHQLPIFGHSLARLALSKKVKLKPYEVYMWGDLECVDVTPIGETVTSENYQFSVYHTPGHSADHVVYLEESQGWLFSGDMFLGPRIKYFRKDENILETIESLRLITSLNFEKLFCGHNPQMHNPVNMISRKLSQLENVYGEVSNLVTQGYSSKAIIAKLLTNKESWRAKLFTMGDVSYRNMLTSSISCFKDSLNTSKLRPQP